MSAAILVAAVPPPRVGSVAPLVGHTPGLRTVRLTTVITARTSRRTHSLAGLVRILITLVCGVGSRRVLVLPVVSVRTLLLVVRGVVRVPITVGAVVIAGRVVGVAGAGPGVGSGRGLRRLRAALAHVLRLGARWTAVPGGARLAIRGHTLPSPLA